MTTWIRRNRWTVLAIAVYLVVAWATRNPTGWVDITAFVAALGLLFLAALVDNNRLCRDIAAGRDRLWPAESPR